MDRTALFSSLLIHITMLIPVFLNSLNTPPSDSFSQINVQLLDALDEHTPEIEDATQKKEKITPSMDEKIETSDPLHKKKEESKKNDEKALNRAFKKYTQKLSKHINASMPKEKIKGVKEEVNIIVKINSKGHVIEFHLHPEPSKQELYLFLVKTMRNANPMPKPPPELKVENHTYMIPVFFS